MVYVSIEGLSPEFAMVLSMCRGSVQRSSGGDGKTPRNLRVPRYVGLNFSAHVDHDPPWGREALRPLKFEKLLTIAVVNDANRCLDLFWSMSYVYPLSVTLHLIRRVPRKKQIRQAQVTSLGMATEISE